MPSSSLAQIATAFVLIMVFLWISGKAPIEETTWRPVECTVSVTQKGEKRCAYREMGSWLVMANKLTSEVSLYREGRASEAYRYTNCSIIDADNWLCREVNPPSGNQLKSTVKADQGRFFSSGHC